jgi:hydrogenase nickel incorporation protein HypB
MCKDCGCGLPGENPTGISAHQHEHSSHHSHDHEHSHGHHDHEHGPDAPYDHQHVPGEHHAHPHTHAHSHPHSHSHEHEHHQVEENPDELRRVVQVRQAILSKNDRLAERNRGFFRAHGLSVLNVLSSPGSGKTTFLRETVRALHPQLKTGIIVGDLATDNDAQRLRASGVPVVQITTGTMCHLEAEMIARAVKELPFDGLQLLIIENVGNLVCPAAYDLGEDLRVVLFSVTEGEDKPLKYPPIFQAADVVIISKMDLAQACDFNHDVALSNIRRAAPAAKVFETSAKTGLGMESWREYLLERHQQRKALDPLAL